MVLDRYAPSLAPDYRARSVLAAARGEGGDADVFERSFPLPTALERALLEVVEAGS